MSIEYSDKPAATRDHHMLTMSPTGSDSIRFTQMPNVSPRTKQRWVSAARGHLCGEGAGGPGTHEDNFLCL